MAARGGATESLLIRSEGSEDVLLCRECVTTLARVLMRRRACDREVQGWLLQPASQIHLKLSENIVGSADCFNIMFWKFEAQG